MKTTRKMDMKRAAELAEMPLEEFLALNPQHNRPVIAGADEHAILLPIDNAEIFAAKLELTDQPLVSWQAYRVKPNETLPQVAAKYGMSVETLRAVNGIGPRTRVPAGHTLLVPSQRPSAEAADSLTQAVFTTVPSGRTFYYTVAPRRHAAGRRRALRRDRAGRSPLEQPDAEQARCRAAHQDPQRRGARPEAPGKGAAAGAGKGSVRQVREALTPEALARLSVAARAHLVALAASIDAVVHCCNLHSHAAFGGAYLQCSRCKARNRR